MPTIDKYGALHAANGQYTFKPGNNGMSYCLDNNVGVPLADYCGNCEELTNNTGVGDDAPLCDSCAADGNDEPDLTNGSSGRFGNDGDGISNNGSGKDGDSTGGGGGGGNCPCHCNDYCDCSCSENSCACQEGCGCYCECWPGGNAPGNVKCPHLCVCDCGCNGVCLCPANQALMTCNCSCKCWIDGDIVLEIGPGDIEALANYRKDFGEEPKCSHGGERVCDNCRDHWAIRANALNQTPTNSGYYINGQEYVYKPDPLFPGEIRFHERAIYAWKLDLFPLHPVRKVQYDNDRVSSMPDFKLPSQYHYLPIELKSVSRPDKHFDKKAMRKLIEKKVETSNKPGNIPVRDFFLDFGELREVPDKFYDDFAELIKNHPHWGIENVWLVDKRGIRKNAPNET